MFRRIAVTIALQFTACIAVLLALNGLLFMTADDRVQDRIADLRTQEIAARILELPRLASGNISYVLPPRTRQRVRVLDAEGKPLFSGAEFAEVPLSPVIPGMANIVLEGEEYRLFTAPMQDDERPIGFVQVLNVQQTPPGYVAQRAMTFLTTSALVSIFIFLLALFFVRRSLRPAEAAMQRLEQFTQDASHELRTPLAALNSSLDLALKTTEYRQGILSAKEDVVEITQLVERLLELARLDSFALQRETVDMSALVMQMADQFQPLARDAGLQLQAEAQYGVTVKADAALLRLALRNLLANAIKFTPKGGTVRIALTKYELKVTDTGIGIAPGDLPHLFDRFFQADTSRSKDGVGLGLALVKRIVDLHGWRIAVTSEVGKGATFAIALIGAKKAS